MSNAENRYWRETFPSIESFVTATEKMRLERIRVICDDDSTLEDVREVFQKILKDEEFHERAFRQMVTPEALAQTSDQHERGLQVLGLTI